GRMDRVVVDAPCTGSGTWRRRPDTKWKLTAEQLAGRVEEQATILEAAARYVKPGGTLFYITCSVLNAENGAQIASFLERYEEFEAVPGGPLLDAISTAAREAAHVDPRGGILLTPRRTGTDGFFAMALRRR